MRVPTAPWRCSQIMAPQRGATRIISSVEEIVLGGAAHRVIDQIGSNDGDQCAGMGNQTG